MGFIKKHSKCLVITILITLVILGGVNIYNNGWKDFIKMNAYEIVTIAIALLVTYYLTERKNDIRKLNNKIENICNNMQVYLREEYGITPSKKNKEKVLMNIRYISNKIHILEKLSEKNKEIKDSISYIKKEHKKYIEFVDDNFDQEDIYFQEENRREKLKSIINNIDNKLDEIIVYLYTGQIPIVHSEQE